MLGLLLVAIERLKTVESLQVVAIIFVDAQTANCAIRVRPSWAGACFSN